MLRNAKPLATLSSGLLARKGQARPAMRSQNFVGLPGPVSEDLGWNDMGQAPDPAAAPDMPPVLIEREALRAQVTAPVAVKPVSVPTATRLRRETQHAGKAAFTLRVDAARHLRLRLATALTNRSAQDLVTEALDVLLGSVPEVEALIAQLPPAKRNR